MKKLILVFLLFYPSLLWAQPVLDPDPSGAVTAPIVSGVSGSGGTISGLTTGTIPVAASSSTLGDSGIAATKGTANNLTVTGGVTGNPVLLQPGGTGSDTNIALGLLGKGTPVSLGTFDFFGGTNPIASSVYTSSTITGQSTGGAYGDYNSGFTSLTTLHTAADDADYNIYSGVTGVLNVPSSSNKIHWGEVGGGRFIGNYAGTAELNILYGVMGQAGVDAALVDDAYGSYSEVDLLAATTLRAAGANFYAFAKGSFTQPVLDGARIQVALGNSAVIVTESAGVRILTPTKAGSAAFTTGYGVKIENQDQAGTNYALYTGTGTVHLGDLTASRLVANNASGNLASTITSANLALSISDETGSGLAVFATSPTLTTPVLGVATATSINGTTIPSSKTLVVTTDKLSVHAATSSSELAGVLSDETGSGLAVFGTSPTLTTPALGTPSALVLTNATGLPPAGVTGTAAILGANTFTGQQIISLNGAASTPPVTLTGTIFTGGSATTTKPQFLIEPAGTTTTNWNTSGSGIGINMASGFAGNFMDFQTAAVRKSIIASDGVYRSAGTDGNEISAFTSTANALAETITTRSVAMIGPTASVTVSISGRFGFSSSTAGVADASANIDGAIMRGAAGQLDVTNGTAATYRDVKLRTLNATTGYQLNGTAGISVTCSILPTQMVISGGIITSVTGGTCS